MPNVKKVVLRFSAKKFDVTFAPGVTTSKLIAAVQSAGSYKAKLAGPPQYAVKSTDAMAVAMTDKSGYKEGSSGKLSLKLKAKKGVKITSISVDSPDSIKVSKVDQKVTGKKSVTYPFKVNKALEKAVTVTVTVTTEGKSGKASFSIQVPVSGK